MVSENGAYVRNQQQGPLQERIADPFPHSLKKTELDMKQLALDPVSDADYVHRRVAQQEIGSAEPRPSSLDASSNGNSVFQDQRTQVRNDPEDIADAQSNMMASVRSRNGTEALRSQSRNNGALSGRETQPSQTSHLQHAHSGVSSDSVHGTGRTPYSNRGGQRNYELNANNSFLKAPTGAGNMASETPRPKLKWQARNCDSDDEVSVPGAASSKGALEDDDRLTQDDIDKSSGGFKESSSVDSVVERNSWRTVGCRRRPLDERGVAGQQLVRFPSGDSDKFSDMYDNPVSVGDYEPSETSSTTLDEVENNDGSAPGRLSSDMGRDSPPRDHGITRSTSRPNLPRSNASSGRSAYSEESVSYSPQMETMSPDIQLDNARRMVADRSHSWDERALTGYAAATAAGTSSGRHGAVSVRQKSISQDYGRGPVEHLHRIASDPGGVYRGDTSQANRSPLHDATKLPLPLAPRPFAQQAWGSRYAPLQYPHHSGQQWSPNSSSRHCFAEPPSPLHLLQSRSFYSSRQMTGQLPPKPGHYPPLPPRGTLPHVLCQHCGILLALPLNLAPPKTNTQKLRCGSCKKISVFSVPHAEDSDAAATVPVASGSDSQHGHSLLASSPDFQATPRASYSRSPAPRPRTNSLGNEDLIGSDQVMAERALSGRAELLTTDLSPTPGSPGQTSPTLTPETSAIASNFSDVPRSNSSNEFTAMSPGGRLISSDSESDSTHVLRLVDGSPLLNKSSFGSAYPNSPPVQDSRPPVRAVSHAPTEHVPESHGPKGFKAIFRRPKSRSGSAHYRRKVVVNGVSVPDHLVKKAEERAGSIHPGQYWYDIQAGFWGVAGGQCLGIIPPSIDEFSHTMPRDCAGGRTGILVNGRELHHLDLEKLARRGLSEKKGISYRIEIDGSVIDESSGLVLRGLGRLAHSLEVKGRGSGMSVPSHISGGSRS